MTKRKDPADLKTVGRPPHPVIPFARRDQLLARDALRCPECDGSLTFVAQTAGVVLPTLSCIGRERKCKGCGFRFRTVELSQADFAKLIEKSTPD